MSLIEEIRAKLVDGLILSRHAAVRSIERDIRVDEIIDTIRTGVVIEDYPDDRYGPSCSDPRHHAQRQGSARSVQLSVTSRTQSRYCIPAGRSGMDRIKAEKE